MPGLDRTLTSIDHALSAKDTDRTRRLLNRLIAETQQANQQGRLDGAEGDRIVAAAKRLLTRLPGQAKTPTPSPAPHHSETPSPPPSNSTHLDGDQGSQGQGEGGGQGGGPNSENGPDNGQGN